MHQYNAASMTELHDTMCEDMLYSRRDDYDWITNTDVVKENVFATADSMSWDCDISRFWVPPSRWTMMVRQYLDPEGVKEWLTQILKRAEVKNANRMVLRTRTVAARFRGNATTRSLGSCMLSVSFSLQPVPTILLHSRTGYLGYLSPLDWSVAYHCGRLAANQLGMDITEFRFQWFAETIQYHRFRTIAFPLGDDNQRRCFKAAVARHKEDGVLPEYVALHRNWQELQKWAKADKQGLTYNEMSNYRSAQRPRKRYHSQVKGYDYALQFADPGEKPFPVLKPLDVKDLRLTAIGLE
ncbi:hypothetical protein SEA_JACOREN57_43 [Mycobacterium phage JacoRen57]|nr:hypothetical protein SEA_JACOREN57_43 [Mycobacterium phage JacoRen57]